MKSTQQGFTLIELVMVIVILGILAATAIPRFVDLSDEANTAALNSTAGTLASAMAINYAGCAANSHDSTDPDCSTINNCNQVGTLLQGGVPTGYTVLTTDLTTTNGATANCTVRQGGATGPTQTFAGISAGN